MKKSVINSLETIGICSSSMRYIKSKRGIQKAWDDCKNISWLLGICAMISLVDSKFKVKFENAYTKTFTKFRDESMKEYDNLPEWTKTVVQNHFWGSDLGQIVKCVICDAEDALKEFYAEAELTNDFPGATGYFNFNDNYNNYSSLALFMSDENELWLCDTFRSYMRTVPTEQLTKLAKLEKKLCGKIPVHRYPG